MELSHKNSFNRHKFVSIGLFMTINVLVVTAIAIQIFEAVENDLFTHLFFGAHIFTGLTFTVLSVIHTTTNWKFIKSYIKNKEKEISREAVYALLLTIASIFFSFTFVL